MNNAATKIIGQKGWETLVLLRLAQIKDSFIDNESDGDFPNQESAREIKHAIVRMVESNKVEALDPMLIIQLLLDAQMEVMLTADADRIEDRFHPAAVVNLIESLKSLGIIGTMKDAGIEFSGSRANAIDGL